MGKKIQLQQAKQQIRSLELTYGLACRRNYELSQENEALQEKLAGALEDKDRLQAENDKHQKLLAHTPGGGCMTYQELAADRILLSERLLRRIGS